MVTRKDDNSPAGNAARDSIAKQQRDHRRRNRGTTDPADWNNADATLILDAVVKTTTAGCAIQFGYTKDGSSYVIRIVGDGEPYNDYVRPSEDINLYLTGLAADYTK